MYHITTADYLVLIIFIVFFLVGTPVAAASTTPPGQGAGDSFVQRPLTNQQRTITTSKDKQPINDTVSKLTESLILL